MIKWIKKRENQIFFSITLITIVIAVCPLLTKHCLLGHDSEYHILRIEALKQQIEMGLPFLKVNPTYFGGAGYASSLFYPDFLLFIPALFRVFGMSINSAYNSFLIICTVLCYTCAYICGKRMTKNRYIGILFAIILTLSAYRLDDINIRAAAGEYTAFIFIPLVLYGIYNLCYEDMDKPWIIGIGMGGVLLCHTLSFIMCIIMICIMLVFNFEVFLKKPVLLLKLAVTAAVTMIVTVSYWIPVVEQFLSDVFYVSKSWIMPSQETVKLSSIFGLTFPTLGIGLLLLIIPRVLIFKNNEDVVMKYADQCASAGIIIAIMASDVVPWDKIGKYASVVQFPWRLYVVSSVLLCFSAAVIVYRISGAVFIGASDTPEDYDNENQVNINDGLINRYGVTIVAVLSILTIVTLYSYSNQQMEYYDYSNNYFDYKPFTASVIAGEWLPLSVETPDTLVDDSEHLVDNAGKEVDFSRIKNSVVFYTDREMEYADVPLVYYKGYSAKGDDGQELYVDGKGSNGFVRVYTNGYEGEISVRYEGTVMQKMARIISLVSVIVIAFIYIYTKRKNKSGK